jgi:hypothetical protein
MRIDDTMMKKVTATVSRPRGRRLWLLPVLAITAGSCGNLTAGGFGEAVVVVSADSPDTHMATRAAALVPSFAREGTPSGAPARSDDRPEGELEATLLLYLVREDGTLVSLSDDELEVSVDLEGVEQDETLPRQIPADVYTDLRIVFLEIKVEVDAGLVIEGDTITGSIDVEMESDSLTVDRPVSLMLDSGERAEILVDLNAAAWLQAVDPATSVVDAGVFADLITVVLR